MIAQFNTETLRSGASFWFGSSQFPIPHRGSRHFIDLDRRSISFRVLRIANVNSLSR